MIVYKPFSSGQPNGLSAWPASLLPFSFTAARPLGSWNRMGRLDVP